MQSRIETYSPVERRLIIEFTPEEVTRRLDHELRRVKNQVQLKGFRPGKVPLDVVEKRFGRQVRADMAMQLLSEGFREGSQGVAFLGEPAVVERGEVERDQPFLAVLGLQVKPELQLSGYTGVVVEYPVQPVTEARVDAAVQARLAKEKALASVTEDRPVRADDHVLVDLRITDEAGKEVHTHPGSALQLADEKYYTGIDALLVGASRGADVEGQVTFSPAARLEELAGRSLQVKAKVLMISELRVPELTDEVATELGFEGGAQGMRVALRAEAEQANEVNARNLARANLLRVLIEANPFPAPLPLVNEQLKVLEEQTRLQATYSGRDPRSLRFSDADVARMRSQAEFAAKAAIILEVVAHAEGVEVTQDDLDAKYAEIARMRDQRVEAIRGYFEKEGAVDELRARVLEEKTLDWLLERADLRPVDPMAPAEAPAEAAAEAAGAQAAPGRPEDAA